MIKLCPKNFNLENNRGWKATIVSQESAEITGIDYVCVYNDLHNILY